MSIKKGMNTYGKSNGQFGPFIFLHSTSHHPSKKDSIHNYYLTISFQVYFHLSPRNGNDTGWEKVMGKIASELPTQEETKGDQIANFVPRFIREISKG